VPSGRLPTRAAPACQCPRAPSPRGLGA
jgi:hypothetical protein